VGVDVVIGLVALAPVALLAVWLGLVVVACARRVGLPGLLWRAWCLLFWGLAGALLWAATGQGAWGRALLARGGVRLPVSGLGGMGGSGGSGHRTPTGDQEAKRVEPAVTLRPVSAQLVVLSKTTGTTFYTRGQDGPGLLTMAVGPAGAGKSEWEFAKLRAAADGAPVAGLPTMKAKKTLLLSEMGKETLKPVLLRWGFGVEPVSRLDYLRLRFLCPGGGALDVLYAADIYRPEVIAGELRQAKWPQVVQAAGDLCLRRGYDRLVVDSLGEWMGSDNNENMLLTLGRCRLLTHQGVGVHVLHHTPRSDPERPRGGTVIEAKLDVGYALVGLGAEGMPRRLDDPARKLKWFKTRFPEATPGAGRLYVRRVWDDPAKPPRYEALAGPVPQAASPNGEPDGGASRPQPQAQQVWAALARRGQAGASVAVLLEDTGLPKQRISDALAALCASGAARQEGTMPAPPKGGIAPARYVVGGAPGAEASA
jgi:hypothetical protein